MEAGAVGEIETRTGTVDNLDIVRDAAQTERAMRGESGAIRAALLDDAADELEARRAECERLSHFMTIIADETAKAMARADHLDTVYGAAENSHYYARKALDCEDAAASGRLTCRLENEAQELRTESRRVAAENARLREAWRPFERFRDAMLAIAPWRLHNAHGPCPQRVFGLLGSEDSTGARHSNEPYLTAEDFDRASEALGGGADA
jgi:hypothetical protein